MRNPTISKNSEIIIIIIIILLLLECRYVIVNRFSVKPRDKIRFVRRGPMKNQSYDFDPERRGRTRFGLRPAPAS